MKRDAEPCELRGHAPQHGRGRDDAAREVRLDLGAAKYDGGVHVLGQALALGGCGGSCTGRCGCAISSRPGLGLFWQGAPAAERCGLTQPWSYWLVYNLFNV